MLREIREATRALALELGVVGLMNVQYGVLGEDLYVIEANPRASRTVPFVSKATGLPLAKIACRVMLGERLADMDLPDDPGGDHISVKEAVMPFDRFAGADALLGPEMRSTGEVMGIAADFPTAFAKAQAAAGARLPRSGTVFLTVTDTDKAAIGAVAAQLHDLGFSIAATGGTAGAIARMGIPVERLNKLGEGSPHVVDKIEGGDVVLVINTPTGTAARRDGYEIRRAAIARGIPCITTIAGGMAAARAIAAAAPRRPGGALAPGDPPRERRAAPRRWARERRDRRTRRARSRRSGGAASPVVARREYGAYVVLVGRRPGRPAPDPGQFAMLASVARWGGGADERPFLPRAFSVARRHDDGTLDFLLEDVGPGTERLAELTPATSSGCSDRWGAASPPPREARRPILVGGGVGIAPLAIWQDALGAGALVLLGFRDAAHAEGAALLADAARSRPTTARAATTACVTELLARLELGRGRRDVEVYACGPPPMLEAVRALCAEHGVPAQLAMESGMACGFGACFGCVVPTRAGYVRLCVDGPVLDAADLELVA